MLKKIFRKPKQEENSSIRLGKDVTLNNTTLSEYNSVGNHCFLHNVKMGSFSYLSSHVTIMNTVIGKFCSIAQGVVISGGMHPSNTFVSTSPVFFSTYNQCGTSFADKSYFVEMGNCKIGNDVWIGANAIIMDNLEIGDGAIVGAGAIVTKSVPPYAIVVGNPARIIKYRFTEEQIHFLLKFKWWEKELLWIEENFKDFHNINHFISKYDKS